MLISVFCRKSKFWPLGVGNGQGNFVETHVLHEVGAGVVVLERIFRFGGDGERRERNQLPEQRRGRNADVPAVIKVKEE